MSENKVINDKRDCGFRSCITHETIDDAKHQAGIKLLSELMAGRMSGETKGWLSPGDMKKHFCMKYFEK